MFTENLIIFVSLLNIILAFIMLVYNLKNNLSIIYLSLFLIFFSINNIASILLINGGSVYLFSILLNNFAPLYYLYPIMLYFYIRSIYTGEMRLKKNDIIHFLPFAINLIAIIPYLFTSFEYKYSVALKIMTNLEEYKNFNFGLFYPHEINNFLRPAQFTFYLILCFIYLLKLKLKLNLKITQIQKRTLFAFCTLSLMIVILISLNVLQILEHYKLFYGSEFDNVLHFSSKVLVNYAYLYIVLPFFLLFNPNIIYGSPQTHNNFETRNRIESKKCIINDKKTEQSFKIENQSNILLSENIKKFLETEKPYLNPDFSIHDICVKLNVPQHRVQYCLNMILKIKFTDLKNEMRVNYAIELLKSDVAKKTSLEGIGIKAGFSSNSNFYKSFKKSTGYTPNQWLEINNREIV